MGDVTKIEWTGSTWNPLRASLKEDTLIPTKKDPLRIVPAGTWGYHCERISPGCVNCYACTMNGRTLPTWGTGLDYIVTNREKVEIFLDEEELLKPLTWKKGRKIFPCSMTDLFADFVPDELIDRMFAVMALCPQHTFQVLTKRARRMREVLSDPNFARSVRDVLDGWQKGKKITEEQCSRACAALSELPLPNVWLGVSVEDQPRAEERIPELLATPAAVRWLSVEPLVGMVDLEPYLCICRPCYTSGGDRAKRCGSGVHWVVVGGESGPGARPMHPEWARAIRDQCVAAGVPLFFKQWGEYRPVGSADSGVNDCIQDAVDTAKLSRTIRVWRDGSSDDGDYFSDRKGGWFMEPVGKKKAGRVLDRREWNQMPRAQAARVPGRSSAPSLECSKKEVIHAL